LGLAAMSWHDRLLWLEGPNLALPSTFLTGTAAAAGMPLLNSVGNIGGFFGPFILGWVKDSAESFAYGLYALAAFMVLCGLGL
jgi:MFS transporter, ACS family, tartrate transporter